MGENFHNPVAEWVWQTSYRRSPGGTPEAGPAQTKAWAARAGRLRCRPGGPFGLRAGLSAANGAYTVTSDYA